MKFTPRFTVRAALVLTAAGVIGAFGACKDGSGPPPPPPPPPPVVLAPTGLAGVPSQTSVALTWTDNATNETGFRLERCGGAGCTNFAQVGTDLAANAVTYTDAGLTASTQYNYRIRAFNAATVSAWSSTATVTTTAAVASSFVMVGAGEITTCASSTGPLGTAHVVDSILTADTSAIAFTAGNNLADSTAGSTYESCFVGAGKWSDFKSRTYYSIGNGDFWGGRGSAGVYGYFGNRTGPADKGWFSFDKGSWHVIFLNTSDWQWGAEATFGTNTGVSEQLSWLTTDLQNNTKPCVIVFSWERRFYTSGTGTLGRQQNMLRMTQAMYAKGVDVLVSSKDKLYARFAQVNPNDSTPDAAAGLRQFIVGTGGRSLDGVTPSPGPSIREAELRQWGVLKLTLAENSYSWQFINTQTPGGPGDSGTATCH